MVSEKKTGSSCRLFYIYLFISLVSLALEVFLLGSPGGSHGALGDILLIPFMISAPASAWLAMRKRPPDDKKMSPLVKISYLICLFGNTFVVCAIIFL
ncbi:MAG: hypothetical protein V1909_02275, partial [Candidatus Micrarchaeota archaeon]